MKCTFCENNLFWKIEREKKRVIYGIERNFSYRISPNKGRLSNKHRSFGYPHRNKRLPLITVSPVIRAAPINEALFTY